MKDSKNLLLNNDFELPLMIEYDQNSIKMKLYHLIDTLSMDDSLFLLQLLEFSKRSDEGITPESVL